MASQFSLVILAIFFYFSFSSAVNHHHHHHHHHHHRRHHHYPTKFSASCRASTDPSKCEAALAKTRHLASTPTPLQAIKSALRLSSQNLKVAMTKVKEIQDTSAREDFNLSMGAKGCLEVLNYSAYRFNLTAKAIPRGRIKDARAWMSAALTYQHGCRSGFQKFVNVSSKVNETVPFLDSLMELTSDTLSMVLNYDIHGNDTASWTPPKTERDGFWEPSVRGKISHFRGGIPRYLTIHATVCKDGSCGFRTVQAAVDAAPDKLVRKKFVIWIKAGVYVEIVRVRLQKRNVVLLGDGMGKTIIRASLNVGIPGMTTSDSATVGVAGDGFMASNLTIKNAAGSEAQQAVAFRSDSDLSVLENVEIIGNQDTLYAKSLRQYYKSCRIQGNVDFIFGNAAAFFQDCEILVAPRTDDAEKGEKNAVTAHARTDPAQSTGFVFDNCVINGTKMYMTLYHSKPSVHKNYLGRPWREYARTVFINCWFEDLVTPEGWMPWNGEFALKTLYYGEFESKGPGADTSRRIKWSNQIPAKHVSIYSVENFIQGDKWIPTSY